jgi:hypothetical protein
MTLDQFNTAVDMHETIKQIVRNTLQEDFPAPRLATVVGVLNTVSMTVAVKFYGDVTPVVISCSAAAAPVTPGMVVRVVGKDNGMLIVEKFGWYSRQFDVQIYGNMTHANVGSWGTLFLPPGGSIEVRDRADPVGTVRWRPDADAGNSTALYINPPDSNPILLGAGVAGNLPFDIDSAIASWALYMDYQTAADSMNSTGLDYASSAAPMPTAYDADTDTFSMSRAGVVGSDYLFYLVNTDFTVGTSWVIPSSWALIAETSAQDGEVYIKGGTRLLDTPWKDLSPYFSSKMQNYSSSDFGKPQFAKFNGIVWFRGLIQVKSGQTLNSGDLVCTMPPGYRMQAWGTADRGYGWVSLASSPDAPLRFYISSNGELRTGAGQIQTSLQNFPLGGLCYPADS